MLADELELESASSVDSSVPAFELFELFPSFESVLGVVEVAGVEEFAGVGDSGVAGVVEVAGVTRLTGVVTLVYWGGGDEEGESVGEGGGGGDGGGAAAGGVAAGGTVTVSGVAGGVPPSELGGVGEGLAAGGPVIASIAVYPATVEPTPIPKSIPIFFKSAPQAALLTTAAPIVGSRWLKLCFRTLEEMNLVRKARTLTQR